MIEASRRGFLGGVGALLLAAPAIVRVSNIMPVRALPADLLMGTRLSPSKYVTVQIDSFGGIIRWVAAPGEKWGLLGPNQRWEEY